MAMGSLSAGLLRVSFVHIQFLKFLVIAAKEVFKAKHTNNYHLFVYGNFSIPSFQEF